MSAPLDKLKKILDLEAEKHEDRAVFGGLAHYAALGNAEASEHFGAYAQRWILEIGDRMRSYSHLGIDQRDDALAAIVDLTSQVPVPTERDGLEAPVTVLHGVGPRQAQRLALLGVQTIRDLLYLFPRRYDDFSHLKPINRLEYGEETTVIARVSRAQTRQTKSGRPIFKAILSDGSGTIEATWFNQRYLGETIKPGRQIVVSGKVDEFLGHLCFKSPVWELFDEQLLHTARIVPTYPLTQGLGARWMRRLVRRTVEYWSLRTPDHLPIRVREEFGLLDLEHALTQIHFPDTQDSLIRARRRLAFDELFLMQLGLQQQRDRWQSDTGKALSIDESTMQELLAGLPFELTGAQKRALNQVADDLRMDRPMHRLLQGDVGSGKTIVAALSMAIAVASGVQVALMAPTEILAEQHYRTLKGFFDKMPESPEVRLLTGSIRGSERGITCAGLADGKVGIAIGTHALIQEGVAFQELGLVIIDEQHRFGVCQRSALRQKGYHPHTLTMTATPIPRSLALTVWGHLDVSVIDEMPPGRKPVATGLFLPSERERAYTIVRGQIEQGHQAFIICPLVEESERIEAKAAVEEYQRLQSQVFSDLRLGLLHGRMKNNEKDEVMSRFVQGELDILVATSVVEVGIDVPNATVMMIEGAERFGLAQLHQFRGRVGRGQEESFCLLVSSSSAERSTERLKAVEATNDGFVLAEKDLELRGPGEFLGTRQAGFPELKLAKVTDLAMIETAREAARKFYSSDPKLENPEHRLLAARVAYFWEDLGEIS
ncbi:MAG: ATP-dependent DNA helicase RecG [Anaerolineae bacterium]|nr:ATP-dependent DNA helicase RecG [Anaerolineae bacterium]